MPQFLKGSSGNNTNESCRDASCGLRLTITADLVSLLTEIQIQCRAGVSFGSFIRQEISIWDSWMREEGAQGRYWDARHHGP